MGERGAIDHFQLTANRHSVRDAAGVYAILTAQLGDIVSGRFPFHRRVGGEDDFLNGFAFQSLLKAIQTDIGRANAVKR